MGRKRQEKKYQVFVSSTYTDLIEERKKVIDILLSTSKCIPVGMELFHAEDDEQFNVIKRIIDMCDYYILIIGSRYGTINPKTDMSFTEMEYDYAVSKGIPILVFALDELVPVKSEFVENKIASAKLTLFREKAMRNRLATIWNDITILGEKVAISILNAIQEYDRPGWVRENQSIDSDIILEKKIIGELLQSLNQQKEIKLANGLTEKWGISAIYRLRQNMNTDCDIDLANTVNQFDIIAFGLRSFRDSQDMIIKQKVKDGLKIRILSMNPYGDFIVQRSIEEAEKHVMTPDSQLKDSIIGLEQWAKNINKTVEPKKYIELRYYNCMTLDFYYRMDDVLYIGPYWYKKSSQQTVSYRFVKGEIFKLYEEYFENLWNDERIIQKVI